MAMKMLDMWLFGHSFDELLGYGKTWICVPAEDKPRMEDGDILLCRRGMDFLDKEKTSCHPAMIISTEEVAWRALDESHKIHLWHMYGGLDPEAIAQDLALSEEPFLVHELKRITVEIMRGGV
jgi:hypothetical protein